MTRWIASALGLCLSICAATGCIPIAVPMVQTGTTTGEKLRALRDLEKDPEQSFTPEQLARVRDEFLQRTPAMDAYIDLRSFGGFNDPTRPIKEYSSFDPPLYESVARERNALQRAVQAGVISQDEFKDLCACLEFQSIRGIVRRQSAEGWERRMTGFVMVPDSADPYQDNSNARNLALLARKQMVIYAGRVVHPEYGPAPNVASSAYVEGVAAERTAAIWLRPRSPLPAQSGASKPSPETPVPKT
ncbi:MAG: hypothetical protein U0636_07305 [Phycisphaerales bacterium]